MSKITAVTPFALTAKGHALQLKVQAGICKLELVGVKIGDGCLEEGQTIESLTDLVHEIPTADGSEETQSPIAALGEVYRDKDSKGRERVMVHVYIRNGDNDSTRITECAVLAKDTDGSTIIYGAINLGDSSMPFDKYNGTTPIVYNWKFPLYISNEANINMSYGFVAGVSREDFDAHTKNKKNPHEVTAAQLGLGNVKTDISTINDRLSFLENRLLKIESWADIASVSVTTSNTGTVDDCYNFISGSMTTIWGKTISIGTASDPYGARWGHETQTERKAYLDYSGNLYLREADTDARGEDISHPAGSIEIALAMIDEQYTYTRSAPITSDFDD